MPTRATALALLPFVAAKATQPTNVGVAPEFLSVLQEDNPNRSRNVSMVYNETDGLLHPLSSCSVYSGSQDGMCGLCSSQTSILGDCFWCSEDNSCHDRGSLDYPSSCYNMGCVSHSFGTGCVGSCAAQTVSGFDVPKAQCLMGISNATYYTGNTLRVALGALGIGSTDYQVISDTSLNTLGVVIAHPSQNAITVAYRGTELGVKNGALDIDCVLDNFQKTITTNQSSKTGGWEVADGFSTAYLSLESQMVTQIQWAMTKVSSKPHLYITGHSLGAAMATIAASAIALSSIPSSLSGSTCYAFAPPRAGNKDFATGVSAIYSGNNYWGVQNFFDQVPHLPPQAIGYQHVQNIAVIGPNDGNIVQVTPTQDADHWNITTNPISFHHTGSYMDLLNSLTGAVSGPTSCAGVL